MGVAVGADGGMTTTAGGVAVGVRVTVGRFEVAVGCGVGGVWPMGRRWMSPMQLTKRAATQPGVPAGCTVTCSQSAAALRATARSGAPALSARSGGS